MSRVRRDSLITVLVLASCIVLAIPCAGAALGVELPEGQLWAKRPALPWDQEAVATGPWAKALNAKLDITRRGKVGETRRYRIYRENTMYDRIGRPVYRTAADATVERTLLKETEPGWWTERLTWTRFAATQTQGPTEVPVPQEVPEAAGLSYEFNPKTFDYVNIPADYSKIQDPMVGYLLKVLGMDFTGFDALVLAARTSFPEGVQIGRTDTQPRWQQGTRITRPTASDTVGEYRLGEMTVSVAGLTRCDSEPCALIWFGAESTDVSHDFTAGSVAMKIHGTEHFWGELVVSLRNGRVVAGELRGPLPLKMEMGMNGQAPQEMTVYGVIQQVSVWEIPATTAE